MSLDNYLYPMLLDRGFLVEPYVYDELDYSDSYISKTLTRMYRSSEKIERIILEMGNGNGGSKYGMKEMYDDTQLQHMFYLDIYTYYPTLYKGLKGLFCFDISDLEMSKGKRRSVNWWVENRIHSDDFKEYVQDKIKNGD